MYQHSSVFILVIRKSNFIFYNINKKPRISVILLMYVVLLYLMIYVYLLVRENITVDSVSLCNFAVDDVRLFYTVEVTCSDSTFHSIPTML